jgi:ATP/maltotriose-dependent transcriptional regulator MalT
LAEGQLDEAESWFKRGLVEAENYDNQRQAANIRANLGLVAQARGDLDGALMGLEAARRAATAITAPHLQIQIDLWLAELYLQREEQAAAREALARAEVGLVSGERRGLQAWAERVRAQLRA